jgi:hypothetical protein
VAIETPQGWLLNAGDAYFHRHEMDRHPHCTPGLAAYQRMMEVDREEGAAREPGSAAGAFPSATRRADLLQPRSNRIRGPRSIERAGRSTIGGGTLCALARGRSCDKPFVRNHSRVAM